MAISDRSKRSCFSRSSTRPKSSVCSFPTETASVVSAVASGADPIVSHRRCRTQNLLLRDHQHRQPPWRRPRNPHPRLEKALNAFAIASPGRISDTLNSPPHTKFLTVLRSPEYCDLAPAQIWARLLDTTQTADRRVDQRPSPTQSPHPIRRLKQEKCLKRLGGSRGEFGLANRTQLALFVAQHNPESERFESE